MKKIIGITPRLLYENNVEKQFVNSRYISFLQDLGYNFITLNLDNDEIDQILSLCDGFLITGGDDINPKLYNEENIASRNISDRMDETDLRVIDFAVKNKKTLIGICRGFQIINVYFQGSLTQDIPNHNNTKHIIELSSNFINSTEIEVNSYHHQAINKLGKDLICFAKSKDGIIEAYHHSRLPIIAFEWHPEIEKSNDEMKIITTFLNKMATL